MCIYASQGQKWGLRFGRTFCPSEVEFYSGCSAKLVSLVSEYKEIWSLISSNWSENVRRPAVFFFLALASAATCTRANTVFTRLDKGWPVTMAVSERETTWNHCQVLEGQNHCQVLEGRTRSFFEFHFLDTVMYTAHCSLSHCSSPSWCTVF